MSDIVDRLRRCERDPMWADHAEIRKSTCKAAADEIERLRQWNANMVAKAASVRDYFAAQAMPAVLQHIEQILLTSPLAMESDMKDAPSQELELHVLESVAFHAYALADAMLKQKEQ